MGLIDKLKTVGTPFGFGGAKPTPTTTAGKNDPQTFFEGSSFDLDGQTPTKYSDTAPENQGGRV